MIKSAPFAIFLRWIRGAQVAVGRFGGDSKSVTPNPAHLLPLTRFYTPRSVPTFSEETVDDGRRATADDAEIVPPFLRSDVFVARKRAPEF